jgi:hypothetical protein
VTAPEVDDLADALDLLERARRNTVLAGEAMETVHDQAVVASAQAMVAQATFACAQMRHAGDAARIMREVRAEDLVEREQRGARTREWLHDLLRRAYDAGAAAAVVSDDQAAERRDAAVLALLDEARS